MATERERARRIIDRLIELSTEKKLAWDHLASGQFGVDLAAGAVTISSEDADDVAPFVFEVRRDSGLVLNSLRTSALADIPAGTRETVREDNGRLRQLYAMARDQALGIGETLQEIEQELGLE